MDKTLDRMGVSLRDERAVDGGSKSMTTGSRFILGARFRLKHRAPEQREPTKSGKSEADWIPQDIITVFPRQIKRSKQT
jgi:hypothetical protein